MTQVISNFFHESRARLTGCHDKSVCYTTRGMSAEDSYWPYQNIDEVRRMQAEGLYLYWKCPTVAHLVETLVASVTGGRAVSHVMEARPGFTNGDLVSINRDIVRFTTENNWRDITNELIRTPYIIGEAMARVVPRATKTPRVLFVDPMVLVKPERPNVSPDSPLSQEQLSELANYGIVHSTFVNEVVDGDPTSVTIDRSDPIRFYARTFSNPLQPENRVLEIDAPQLCYRKLSRFSQQPRGVHPWCRIAIHSLGLRELTTAARDFALRVAEHAIIEKLSSTTTTEDRISFLDAETDSQRQHTQNTGERFKTGAKKVAANVETIVGTLNMGANDMISLSEADKLAIGSQIGAPDVVSLGRSNMGARNTSDVSMGTWYATIRNEQGNTYATLTDLVWRALAIMRNWSPDQVCELRSTNIIKPTGWRDAEQNPKEYFENVSEAAAVGAIPLSCVADAVGKEFEPDKIRSDRNAISEGNITDVTA